MEHSTQNEALNKVEVEAVWADRRSSIRLDGRQSHREYMRIGLRGQFLVGVQRLGPKTMQSYSKRVRNLKIDISFHLSCGYRQVEILNLAVEQVLAVV